MADVLPQNFPPRQGQAIASYPYTEIKEGTGKVTYYGTRVEVDNTTSNDEHLLVTNTNLHSDEELTVIDNSSSIDFDVQFNTPKIVRGDIVIQIPIRIMTRGDVGSIAPQVTIIKWDGTSETTLVSQTTFASKDLNNTSTTGYQNWLCKIPISLTKFKAGETLRVNFEFSESSNASFWLGHNPVGNTEGFPKTGGQLIVEVPFKIVT